MAKFKPKKQTDSFRCGPIAAYNALGLLGIPKSWAEIKRKLKAVPGHGIDFPLVEKYLSKFLKCKPVKAGKIDNQGTFLIRLITEETFGVQGGHFVVLHKGRIYNFEQGRISSKYHAYTRAALLYNPAVKSHPDYKPNVYRLENSDSRKTARIGKT